MKYPMLPVAIVVALAIFLAEEFFGAITVLSDPTRDRGHYSHAVSDTCYMAVKVVDLPRDRKKSIRLDVAVRQASTDGEEVVDCKGKMIIYLQSSTKSKEIKQGDILFIHAKLSTPTGATNPHQFDYARYLKQRGVVNTAYLEDRDYVIVDNECNSLKDKMAKIRQKMISAIQASGLTPQQQGIAEAMFLGWDNDLDDNTKQMFRQSGITHLLCVSGLHVGIVLLSAGLPFAFLGNKRRVRSMRCAVQIATVWFFVLLTGMAPATLRAGLMFTIIALGDAITGKPPTINAIATAAVITMVFRPSILFDVGFQLSYTATTAIVAMMPTLAGVVKPLNMNKTAKIVVQFIWDSLCVSVVAQAALTPFTLYYFHQFPTYFLVANLLVVPFASILLGSIIIMSLFMFWPWFVAQMGRLVSAELYAVQSVTATVSGWKMSMIENIYFDGFMLLVTLIIVVSTGWIVVRKQPKTIVLPLVMATVLAGYARIIDNKCREQHEWCLYDAGNHTAIEFFNGKKSYLIADSAVVDDPTLIDYQTKNNLVYHKSTRKQIIDVDDNYDDGTLVLEDRFVGFGDVSIRIVDRSNVRMHSTFKPKVDYVIVRESPFVSVKELQDAYDFDTLLIASQNSTRRKEALIDECKTLGQPFATMH